jgi:hypothetical protein
MSRRRGKKRGAVSRRTIAGFVVLGAIAAVVLVVVVAIAWSVVGGFQLKLGGPTGAPVISAGGGPPQVVGTVTAGPVCAVEASSPDPQCAPRPVSGAVIVVTDSSGLELGRTTTGPTGTYALIVGKTGAVIVKALPVDGLPGTPSPVSITLSAPGTINRVDLEFDTGIR